MVSKVLTGNFEFILQGLSASDHGERAVQRDDLAAERTDPHTERTPISKTSDSPFP